MSFYSKDKVCCLY